MTDILVELQALRVSINPTLTKLKEGKMSNSETFEAFNTFASYLDNLITNYSRPMSSVPLRYTAPEAAPVGLSEAEQTEFNRLMTARNKAVADKNSSLIVTTNQDLDKFRTAHGISLIS